MENWGILFNFILTLIIHAERLRICILCRKFERKIFYPLHLPGTPFLSSFHMKSNMAEACMLALDKYQHVVVVRAALCHAYTYKKRHAVEMLNDRFSCMQVELSAATAAAAARADLT